MASSRIFVKNLPPQLKENDFKKHFSSLAPITDANLLSKRRIGYVGYKSAEIAQKAVKYYNKSFIRMSRINVELARAIDEVQPRKKPRYQEDAPFEKFPAESRANAVEDSSKLQEFLDTMAPSSKSKTWANEDFSGANKENPVAEAPVKGDDDAPSDEDYQTISKKRKRTATIDVTSAKGSTSLTEVSPGIEIVTHRDTSITDGLNDLVENSAMNVDEELPAHSTEPTSDSDWLRSKTSRLLGLMDDEDSDNVEVGTNVVTDSEENGSSSKFETTGEASTIVDTIDTIDEDIEQQAQESTPPLENSDTGRLFLRNLTYGTSEGELEGEFSKYGSLEEVHISKDTRSGASRGFGYVQFTRPEDALAARKELDGRPFQGRLLHIILAKAKKANGLDEFEISKLPLKVQRDIRRKVEASTATFKWNSMYMNPDAILSSVASRLGVSKTDVLDPTSSDAAVKQAHAETNVIRETKNYFSQHGVNLDSFKGKEYNDRAILVKNFPYGTSAEELKKMFEVYGIVTRLLMPRSATIAIVEMEQSTQSRSAFRSLAYRKFKDSILFLEKAPKALFTSEEAQTVVEMEKQMHSSADLLTQDDAIAVAKSTLFVRNLNFSTTSLDLRDLFIPLDGFMSATVKTKTDAKKPGQTLSMGFGFVEFQSKEQAQSAMAAMNGHKLAGHELMIKESNKAIDAAEERRKEDAAKKLASRRTKIIIRNLPFEATKKDVRALFGPYGQLRTVRVPRKFDSTSRGFAFAEFVTTREAENAIKSLTGVHLLGRRLALEYALGDDLDAEEEIAKMSKKVSKQADKMALQNLTGGGRKKFSVWQGEDTDIV